MTVKVGDRIYILETNIRDVTVGYHSYREILQSTKGPWHAGCTVKSRAKERREEESDKSRRKGDREAKRCHSGQKFAKGDVEGHDIRDSNPKPRDGIYRAGFRIREIVQKAREGK